MSGDENIMEMAVGGEEASVGDDADESATDEQPKNSDDSPQNKTAKTSTSPPSPTTTPSSSSLSIYRTRCGECDACRRVDCRNCDQCRRKKKYGGDGSSKQACIHRKCTNLQYRELQTKRRTSPSTISNSPIATLRKDRAVRMKANNSSTYNDDSNEDYDNTDLSSSKKQKRQNALSSTVSRSDNTEQQWRPAPSLLQVPDDSEVLFQDDHSNKRMTADSTPKPFKVPTHFAGQEIPTKFHGVCGGCGLDETQVDDTIVLCDGIGCNQEFHLQCCRPPLTQIPKGDFYCWDCSKHGSTSLLKSYLEEMEDSREEYYQNNKEIMNSLDFVDHLIYQDIREQQPLMFLGGNNTGADGPKSLEGGNTEGNAKGGSQAKKRNNQRLKINMKTNEIIKPPPDIRVPCSELDIFHNEMTHCQAHFLIQNESSRASLVGKTLRLYCPKTNDYHTGRIMKVQPPIVGDQIIQGSTWDTECLVRFPAGRDHRKTNLTRWIRLEEHSIAIAVGWALGLFGPSETAKSPYGSHSKDKSSHWLPASLWLRSSRELVMVMHVLREHLGQIHYRSWRLQKDADGDKAIDDSHKMTTNGFNSAPLTFKENKKQETFENVIKSSSAENPLSRTATKQEWILGEVVGRGTYKLLNVSAETKEHCLSGAHTRFASTTSSFFTSPSRRLSNGNLNSNKSMNREAQIMLALIQAEEGEQERVRQWTYDLPLLNGWHPKAITCQDEQSLEPLLCEHPSSETSLIEPSPVVRQGMDRMYILDQLVPLWEKQNCRGNSFSDDKGNLWTKDVGMSLEYTLIDSGAITACIQNQNLHDRRLLYIEKDGHNDSKQSYETSSDPDNDAEEAVIEEEEKQIVNEGNKDNTVHKPELSSNTLLEKQPSCSVNAIEKALNLVPMSTFSSSYGNSHNDIT